MNSDISACISSIRRRMFKITSAAAIILGMLLAAMYGTGEYLGEQWLSIDDMARLHGPINGVGFSVLGLLGFLFAVPCVGDKRS